MISKMLAVCLLFMGNAAFAQQTVQGTVTNEQGEPLIGATVLVKGTARGTVTDIDGSYSVPNVPDNGILVFSYTGYETLEIDVTGTQLDVTLAEGTVLDEVIVVGYGRQIQSEVTGSVQTVDAKALEDLPVAQMTEKLQGRIAGVQINQATGKPGEGMTVRVRGQASILASSDPLYVVDGFPIVGGIANINPDEIQSVTVLKDAASTSLYGSRAANGVVLITTKMPAIGQSNFGVNFTQGFATVPERGRPDMMNAEEFARFKKESAEALGAPVPDLFQNPEQYRNNSFDWYDAMLRTAPYTNLSISAAKRTENFGASLVGGFMNQDGVMLNSGFDRYSFRLNATYDPFEMVNIGVNIAPTYTVRNTPSSDGAFYASNIDPTTPGGLLYNATLTWPVFPFENEDGSLPLTAWQPGVSAFPTPNWYRALQEIDNETKTTRLLSNAYIEVEPLPGLSLKSTFNVDLGASAFRNFKPSTTSTVFASLPPNDAELITQNSDYMSWLNENIATYTTSFGDHDLQLLAGYSAQKYRMDAATLSFSNFPDDRIQTIQSAVNVNRPQSTSQVEEWALVSLFSRINYDYKNKYLLQLSVRRDGSSRFGSNNRWGTFPAVGVGWVMSDENFLQGIDWLSFLKVRASYGTLGNNNIGNYTQYALVNNTANAVFGNNVASGAFVSTLGNPNLGWETTQQLDIGFDLELFNGRVGLAYDYYNKNTTNLLYNVATAQESGFSNFNDNVGELRFWGHELALTTRNVVGEFNWTTNLNLARNQNEVLALADGIDRIFGGQFDQTITQVGQPIGMFYGLVWDGVYVDQSDFDANPQAPQSQVGTIKYRDVNGDGVISYGGDNDDRTIIGNPFPDVIIGLVNTFNYKNFDLSIVASGQFGNDIMVLSEQGQTNLDGVFNVLREVENRWRSPQDPGDGRYGKTTAATFMERDWMSSRFVDSGDFFTIKNITLGYTHRPENTWFQSVRLFCSIQQALVLTNYRGSNPEVSTTANGTNGATLNLGMDWSAYPVPRTVSFGLNVGF